MHFSHCVAMRPDDRIRLKNEIEPLDGSQPAIRSVGYDLGTELSSGAAGQGKMNKTSPDNASVYRNASGTSPPLQGRFSAEAVPIGDTDYSEVIQPGTCGFVPGTRPVFTNTFLHLALKRATDPCLGTSERTIIGSCARREEYSGSPETGSLGRTSP